MPGLGEKASPQWPLAYAYAWVDETPMASQPGDEILQCFSTFNQEKGFEKTWKRQPNIIEICI